MRVHLTTLINRPPEPPIRRDREVELGKITIGRNNNSDIYLHDKSVLQDHAEIGGADGNFHILAQDQAELLVNGHGINAGEPTALASGDRIEIGPYAITVEGIGGPTDLSLTIERFGLNAESGVTTIEPPPEFINLAPSLRQVSWASFLLLLLIALILPLALGSFTATPANGPIAIPAPPVAAWTAWGRQAWNAGKLSNAHAALGDRCEACHAKPFAAVASDSCLSCHRDLHQHADPKLLDVAATGCTTCHQEHHGETQVVRNDQAFCTSCHAALTTKFSDTKLMNVADFGRDHPQFRPAVFTGTGTERQRISLDDKPVNHNNLLFNHKVHLATGGVRGPAGMEHMVCADCHVPEAGGAMMQPVRMAENCSRCHTLSFDPTHPDRVLPHGNVKLVAAMVVGLFSRDALGQDPSAPAKPALAAPGIGLALPDSTPMSSNSGVDGIDARTTATLARIYTQTTCRFCHLVQPPPANDPLGWSVAPVHQVRSLLPKAGFDHSKHATTQCTDCHAAPDSTLSGDPLLPGIASCQTCHAGETARSGLVASSCMSCHSFHDAGPTMTSAAAPGQRLRKEGTANAAQP